MITKQDRSVPFRLVAGLTLAAVLTACGGGGGGGDAPAVAPSGTLVAGGSASGGAAAAGQGGTPAQSGTPASPAAGSSIRITGLTQQAASNSNYTVASSTPGTVRITLPANPAAGDTVRVSGESANQWTIAQNAGQSINTTSLASNRVTGQAWTVSNSTPRNWWAVASSGDGLKLVAITNGAIGSGSGAAPLGTDGQIYTSTDGGANWTVRPTAGNNSWSSVASSFDGVNLAAVGPGNQIWTSGDSGVTWVPRDVGRFWTSITMSADGSRMAATVEEGPNSRNGATNVGQGRIYVHTQTPGAAFGVGSWTPAATARNWRSITMSDDGQRLAAVAHTDGGTPVEAIYRSVNGGATWTATGQTFSSAYRIRSSADGTRLVMAEGYPVGTEGRLWTSTDSGVTWVRRNAASTNFYTSVDISADGSKMLAVQDGGQIQASVDSGVTWTARDSGRAWRGVAMSTDGNRATALVNGGVSYSSIANNNRTTIGENGGLTGATNNTITLTYVGGGVFDITASSGAFSIQ